MADKMIRVLSLQRRPHLTHQWHHKTDLNAESFQGGEEAVRVAEQKGAGKGGHPISGVG